MADEVVIDLVCSGCGEDKNEIAALRTRSGDIVALMCKGCLQEAIDLITKIEQGQEPGRAN